MFAALFNLPFLGALGHNFLKMRIMLVGYPVGVLKALRWTKTYDGEVALYFFDQLLL